MVISIAIERCLKRERDIGRKAVLSDVKTAVHVYPRLNPYIFNISLLSSANQELEMTKVCLVWATQIKLRRLIFRISIWNWTLSLQAEHVFRAIGEILGKFCWQNIDSPFTSSASPSLLLKGQTDSEVAWTVQLEICAWVAKRTRKFNTWQKNPFQGTPILYFIG